VASAEGGRIEILKALSAVEYMYVECCLLPSLLGVPGEHYELPSGSGAEPRPETHLGVFQNRGADSSDESLFRFIRYNPQHVLHQLLPPHKHTGYNLRYHAIQ